MKNITIFAVLVIVVLCTPPAGASPPTANPYTLKTGPQFGVLYGQCEEIVYPDGRTKGELWSQLLWDIQPVYYYGMALDFSRADPFKQWGFFSVLSLKNGIPVMSGFMEDRDWMSVENDSLTHYSIHNNEIRGLLWLDASAGLSIPVYSVFLLKVYASGLYMRFAFSGLGGFGTYARETPPNSGIFQPIDDYPDLVDFAALGYEKVINYTQEWLVLVQGLSLDYRPFSFVSIGLSLRTNLLVLCVDLDEHLTTNTQYRDYMRGGMFFEPGVNLSYYFNKWMSLSFDFSWRYIAGTRGAIYSRSYGTGSYTPSSDAGAGLSIMDTALLFKVRL